jgi:hypothetical protein
LVGVTPLAAGDLGTPLLLLRLGSLDGLHGRFFVAPLSSAVDFRLQVPVTGEFDAVGRIAYLDTWPAIRSLWGTAARQTAEFLDIAIGVQAAMAGIGRAGVVRVSAELGVRNLSAWGWFPCAQAACNWQRNEPLPLFLLAVAPTF